MTTDKFKNYLLDLGVLLKEKAREAKCEKDFSSEKNEIDYKLGYLMAYHEVISLMKQQADAFEINQKDIGLYDIDPELELL